MGHKVRRKEKHEIASKKHDSVAYAKAVLHTIGMYELSRDKRVAVITAPVEGCSIRSTVRMTGVAKETILRLPSAVTQNRPMVVT
jgi:hypothetical protein